MQRRPICFAVSDSDLDVSVTSHLSLEHGTAGMAVASFTESADRTRRVFSRIAVRSRTAVARARLLGGLYADHADICRIQFSENGADFCRVHLSQQGKRPASSIRK